MMDGASQPDPQFAQRIRAAARGDAAAAAELHRVYRPYLALAIAPRIPRAMLARFDTEDILQSAFAAAFAALPDYDASDEPAFRAWLRQIALRKLQDKLREQGRAKRSVWDTLSDPGDFHARVDDGPGGDTPSTIMSRDESQLQIVRAIERMPAQMRRVVILRCFERRTFPQIAAELQIDEDRARRQFVASLEELQRTLG